MPTHVVFLRAVNVRPRWIKMQALRESLLTSGFADVETYIQSGNLRLHTSMRSPEKVAAAVRSSIQREFGFDVPCIVRTPRELRDVAACADILESPLPDLESRRYVTFCAAPISVEAAASLNRWNEPGERVLAHDAQIHWWLSKPSHEAKLTNARVETLVGVATTRDLKVVRTLAERWGR